MLLLIVMAMTKGHRLSLFWRVLLLLIEILVMNALVAFNGAASNPFNALLLLPVVMACLWLPIGGAGLLVLFSVSLQWAQWWLLQQGSLQQGLMSHGMAEHAQSMVIGFSITSGLVMTVIFYLRARLFAQEQQLQQLREKQLRDEQLLAIGTAAAQLAHDLATPAQSAKWLLEEGKESFPQPPLWLVQLEQAFSRMQDKLDSWRVIADEVRTQKFVQLSVADVEQEIKHVMSLARPESMIEWHLRQLDSGQINKNVAIIGDRTLVPALCSIIVNACDAESQCSKTGVKVATESDGKHWHVRVTNVCKSGQAQQLERLGVQLVESQHGHGAGAVISNATLEKFGGQLRWETHNHEVTTWIMLPLS